MAIESKWSEWEGFESLLKDEVVDLPRPTPTGRNVTVLTGQRVEIPGVLGQPILTEVLSGKAQFQVVVSLSYGTTGVLSRWQHYRYRTTQRFNAGSGLRWFNIDTESN